MVRIRDAFALDLRSLAAYRIALGVILCVDCAQRAGNFAAMGAADGVFPPDAIRRVCGTPWAWSLAFLDDRTWWNAVVLALEGVSGLLLALGVATRLATAAAWVAVWSVIRRTAPACAGGDAWLACQLFWAMFLPLGAVWSVDSRRRASAVEHSPGGAARSVATVALVLQLATVYVSAGVAKCDPTWAHGGALAHALSPHVHGTSLGAAFTRSGLAGDSVGWIAVALEIVGPLVLLAWPSAGVRAGLVVTFVAFHAAIGLTLTVGLFAPIGMAAWLPIVPAAAWNRCPVPAATGRTVALGGPATVACAAALALAAVSFVGERCLGIALPGAVNAALTATGLHQDWRMFGRVPAEERWVTARAVLSDGRVVDVLRGGRAWRDGPPEGGFASLPDDRWRNLCRCLAWPAQAPVAPAVAAGLARRWNATHRPESQVTSLEIRDARRLVPTGDVAEKIVASWPPRDAAGHGNLDRLLPQP